ncbi:MAG: 2-oxoglutarate dehydrogenase E1 component [Trueperaceae bacterium]|nr:2-oxoglutarate dehydrogenase E1 component [Trueperaceae bacterium]
MSDTREFNSQSLGFFEDLYLDYLRDPQSVDSEWRDYFASLPANGSAGRDSFGPSFQRSSIFNPPGARNGHAGTSEIVKAETGEELEVSAEAAALQYRVDKLVRNYRVRGHISAELDPLGRGSERPAELEPSYYGFTDADMERVVPSGTMAGRTLREVIERLKTTYCRSVGVQFMHIDDLEVRKWLQEQMEESQNQLDLTLAQQRRILETLTNAVVFEDFLQKKYVGAKSFSLEGGESLIPLLDLAIEASGQQGIRDIVLGMAHRGRLNVLANIMSKRPADIFREFDDVDPEEQRGRGDVKYHLGYSSDWRIRKRPEHPPLALLSTPATSSSSTPWRSGAPAPSRTATTTHAREHGMAILIHGDAAFIGEGVVQETLNLSELPGYHVGGTLHVVVNNQIGFTTSPAEGRSTTYATDVAKMLQSPIFHVNGEDPEAVAQVVKLAMDFRHTFKRDVVIDMYCYRRFGHNEGDEPRFTQPQMYEAIRKRKSVREAYLERLLAKSEISKDEADTLADERRAWLEEQLALARRDDFRREYQAFAGIWEGYQGGREEDAKDVDTGISDARVKTLLEAQVRVPEDFKVNSKIKRNLDLRLDMAAGERPLDWAAAEALALASLVTEGHRVRMTGQDAQRGTFSHRHAMLHDGDSGAEHMPLQHLAPDQAPLEIHNSPLSEAGVLGYEYGYSLDWPEGLTVWEAQFGDFVNAGQVIIDQFIASGEDKWQRLSGLVMLLPHGFEGQGPEHSSARLERFLMLCAEDNMQIANVTTPAQYFHLLRRQVLRPWRKPLIVMTPKSLLRHPKVISEFSDFTSGTFQRVLADPTAEPNRVSRVLLCSGKVYFDLLEEREELGRDDVAIVRLEQLYPFPHHRPAARPRPLRCRRTGVVGTGRALQHGSLVFATGAVLRVALRSPL